MDSGINAAGFTLVELLTALAVAGVVLAIAVPAFNRTILSNRLSATSNTLVSALSQARLQAVRSNQLVAFCSNSAAANGTDALGNQCGTAVGAVYAMQGAAAGADPVQAALTLPAEVQLGDGSGTSQAVAALRYAGDGIARGMGSRAPYTGLVADVFTSHLSSDNHRCVYMATGSVINTCSLSQVCPQNAPANCQ